MKLIAPVRRRTRTKKWAGGTSAALVALAMVAAFPAPAEAAGAYVSTRVASTADGFNPQTLRISCPSINNPGDIAFKSERNTKDGRSGRRLSNERGWRHHAHLRSGGGRWRPPRQRQPIDEQLGSGLVRGNVTRRRAGHPARRRHPFTTIAGTSNQRIRRFLGRETSINDTGEVAFDGQLGSGAGVYSRSWRCHWHPLPGHGG